MEGASSTSNDDVGTVQVRFVSGDESIASVPEVPFSLPLDFARWGLSQLVNTILEQKDSPQPYDFLINGKYLRSTLQAYLVKQKLSAEVELELTYVHVFEPPQSRADLKVPDWISDLDCTTASGAGSSFILSACYDGIARVVLPNGRDIVSTATGHGGAITSVRFLNSGAAVSKQQAPREGEDDDDDDMKQKQKQQKKKSGSHIMYVTGSKDKTVRVWGWNGKKGSASKCLARSQKRTSNTLQTVTGHTDSVDCVDTLSKISGGRVTFVSGGFDNRVILWDLARVSEELRFKNRNINKKPKLNPDRVKQKDFLKPVLCFEGHTQAVSAVCYAAPTAVYSASWDMSMKLWDVNVGINTTTWSTGSVFTDLVYSEDCNLLASSHVDNVVRVWDPRKQGKEAIKFSLKSHTNWVSSVAWAPAGVTASKHETDAVGAFPLLATASYDKTVKLWDLRSSLPLSTEQTHNDKVLAVRWMKTGSADNEVTQLVSGGADTRLHVHALQ